MKRDKTDATKRARRKLAVWAAAVAAMIALTALSYFIPFKSALPAYSLPSRAEGEMRVHFLSVGQGDCTVIEFPNGEVLVADAGDGSFDAENKIIRYLKGLDVSSFSFLATHADIDHYGGLRELLEIFPAEKVYLPLLETDTLAYRAFVAAAGAETEVLTRYDTIVNGSGAYAVCISPYSVGEEDENDSSTVLYLSYEGVNFLFCGDISSAREETLLREYSLYEGIFDSGFSVRLEETNILKVSHHGSAGASSAEWLALLGADAAIVSCGRGNSYSHPAAESVARLREAGAEIYRTDELGDVVVSVRNGSYTIYTNYTE